MHMSVLSRRNLEGEEKKVRSAERHYGGCLSEEGVVEEDPVEIRDLSARGR